MKNHPNVPDEVREMFSMQTARSSCVNCETLRNELERLHRLVPTGTYTLNVQYEEEIQRLKDAGEVLVRSLERMTCERDEALENVETLKTHVETVREAWHGASEAVSKLGEQLNQSETDCERYAQLLDDCRDLLMTQYDPEDNLATIRRIEEALGVCKSVVRKP